MKSSPVLLLDKFALGHEGDIYYSQKFVVDAPAAPAGAE